MTKKKGRKNPFFSFPNGKLLPNLAAPLLAVPLLRQQLCLWLFWGKWLGFFGHGTLGFGAWASPYVVT
jgi:hypothetical protein